MLTDENAMEAIESLDDYARMEVGVDPIGPREVLKAFVAQQAERIAELELQLILTRRAQDRLKGLRELCGYIEEGCGESIHIGQDDATKDWILRIGPTGSKKWYYAESFAAVIDKAIAAQGPKK